MPKALPDPSEIALNLLGEPKVRELAAQGTVTPQVVEAFEEYSSAIRGHKAAADEYVAIRDELNSRANQIQPQGLRDLQQQARQNYESASREYTHQAKRAFAKYEGALADQAIPRLTPERESAARRELDVVLSGGNPESAGRKLAIGGSHEALAVLVSTSYGRASLEARGVPDPDRVIAETKKTVASLAGEHGSTPRQLIAGKLLKSASRLAAAQGSIGANAHSALYQDDQIAARRQEQADQDAEARG